jgi:hypothetical protein
MHAAKVPDFNARHTFLGGLAAPALLLQQAESSFWSHSLTGCIMIWG